MMFKRPRDDPRNDPSSTTDKCCFCGTDAVNIIEGAFPKAYCLLHYYTTRACRKKNVRLLNNTSAVAERERHDIQALFSDAFLSLQLEIKEAAARYNPKDPLSLLDTSFSKKSSLSNEPKVRPKAKVNGGFMPDITDLEKNLMDQHMKSSIMKEEPPNPYKRKKFPSSTVWHRAMNDSLPKVRIPETPQFLDKCPCGSHQVIRDGNSIHRSEEGTKAEIWGTKQDNADAVDRYRCLTCGTSWIRHE